MPNSFRRGELDHQSAANCRTVFELRTCEMCVISPTVRTAWVLCLILASVIPAMANAEQTTVMLERAADGPRLLRNGRPFFVRGVGGDGSRAALAAAGGNSVRTWSAERVGPVLDECQKLGLTVTVGIWLGHERHGFNYNDADQVAKQLDEARKIVETYKNHPAVLLWGIGNEMEGYEQADNAAVWSAVNTVASMAKRLDPNHPTMTVIAEIGGQRVKNVHRLCPDIDIVGINSYGGAATLPKRYREAGGTKPFLLTEFGPLGSWESPKTAWGAPREPTSTEKAESYRRAFTAASEAKGLCLGGYAFLWGHKQETTATWFGMLLPDGKRLGAVDVMTELWTGKPPANRCPRIEQLTLAGGEQVEPGTMLKASLVAGDPDRDEINVKWVVHAEAGAYGTGGDAEPVPATFPQAIVRADSKQAEFRAPADGGGYRVFAYVDDGRGNAAVANVPFFVKGPVVVRPARMAQLPLTIYDEADRADPPFLPTGWMGNTKAIQLDPACEVRPHGGKTCLKATYRAAGEWGGVVWQHPANDWGDQPGGWNLTGAKRLTFWARGESGDESVSFEFGILGREKKFSDTGSGKLDKVRLTTDWQSFSLPLEGKDLTRIKSGFVWAVAGSGKPVTFFLDDIRFE